MAEPQIANLHEKINIRGKLNAFLDILIEKFQTAMDKEMIVSNDVGYNSFKKALFYSGGDISTVQVSFNKYLRFVDMGVGKGMPVGSRRALGDSKYLSKRERNGQLKKMSRRAKPWYGKTKASQTFKLRELLIRDYGINLVQEIERGITTKIDLNLN